MVYRFGGERYRKEIVNKVNIILFCTYVRIYQTPSLTFCIYTYIYSMYMTDKTFLNVRTYVNAIVCYVFVYAFSSLELGIGSYQGYGHL